MGSNDSHRTMHALKKQKPQGETCGSCNKKEEKKNEKEDEAMSSIVDCVFESLNLMALFYHGNMKKISG